MTRSLMLAVLLSIPLASFAQSNSMQVEEAKKQETPLTPEPPKPAAAPEEDKKELVEVTGSHIRQIDVEGASPVLTVSRKKIEDSGVNSMSDVLRTTTVNSFGGARENAGSNTPGFSSVDLRGLGADHTLVLLNGQRMPTDAVNNAVDLNLIPTAAVERVEILKDGASAVYGSDALAGVVNMITRKDFEGTQADLSQTTPNGKGGTQRTVSLTNGITKGSFNMLNVIQYRNNDTLYSKDRSFTNNVQSPIGTPGSYTQGDHWAPSSNCPKGELQHSGDGDICRFNTANYSTQLPSIQQISLFHDNNVHVGSRLKFNTRIIGTNEDLQSILAPVPADEPGISAAAAQSLGLQGIDPTKTVELRFRPLSAGNRVTRTQTQGGSLLEDASIDLGAGWQADVIGSHNVVKSRNVGTGGYLLEDRVIQDIESGRYNPITDTGSLTNAQYRVSELTQTQYSSAEAKASGPLAQMPSGDLSLAVGTTFSFQRYSDVLDDQTQAQNIVGQSGSSGKGQRDARAAYTELMIPVTKKFTVTLAERYDHYSDFGDTANPKLALAYRPAKQLLLRSSIGTGFKAPNLTDLYGAQAAGYPTYVDAVSCNREKAAGGATPSCTPQQYLTQTGGNPNLSAEKSLAISAGAVVQPIRDLNTGVDVFFMKMKDVVGLDYDDAFDVAAHHVQGNDNGRAFLANHGITVTRDASGYITKVIAPTLNLSSQEITGLDFDSGYRWRRWNLTNNFSKLFYFKQEGFPGAGMRNRLGDNGRPGWRNAASLGYSPAERHNLALIANSISGQRKEVKSMGSINDYTSFDVQYAYAAKHIGTFTVGFLNVLGTRPPLDDSNPQNLLNYALYEQMGPAVYTSYQAAF